MRVQSTRLTERHRTSFHDFMGIDMASAPSEVAFNRATQMSNFIYEDGLVRKRHGWTQQLRITSETKPLAINGLFELELCGQKIRLAYAGKNFYLLKDKSFVNVTSKIFNSERAKFDNDFSNSDLTPTKCQVFVSNDRAYFIGIGDFIMLGDFGRGGLEFRKVYDSAETTIPTTTTFISESQAETPTRKPLDDDNLMTSYRKNRLIGYDMTAEAQLDKMYRLDASIENNSDVRVKIETASKTIFLKSKASSTTELRSVEQYDDLSNVDMTLEWRNYGAIPSGSVVLKTERGDLIRTSGIRKVNGKDVMDVVYGDTILATLTRGSWLETWKTDAGATTTLNMGDCGVALEVGLIISAYGTFKATLPTGGSLVDDSGAVKGSIKYSAGVITLNKELGDLTAKIPSDDNIEVTFKAVVKGKAEKSASLRNAKLGVVFGVSGADDRLFLADGTNTDYFSESDDFTYFGASNYVSVGTAPIVGYLRLNDSTLAVLKGGSTQDSTLYVRSGRYDTKYDTQGNVISQIPLFTTTSANTSIRAVGNLCNVTLDNDSMFLSYEGLYGVELAHNLTTDTRQLRLRSNTINKGLQVLELDKAVGIVYKNKLYIAQGGKCYVADARFKHNIKSDMASTFNYEWWVWDNIPATTFSIMGGELYFGTEQGQICSFDESYTDSVTDEMLNGTVLSDRESIMFSVNLSTAVENADTFNFSKTALFNTVLFDDGDFGINDGGIDVGWFQAQLYPQAIDKAKELFVGMKFEMNSNGRTMDAEVTFVDYMTGLFRVKCDKVEGIYAVPLMYRMLAGFSFKIVDKDMTNNTFKIVNEIGYPIKKIQGTIGTGTFGKLVSNDVVKASWYTPITDLGACDLLKNMESITVAVDSTSTGRIEVGYITRRSQEVAMSDNKTWVTDPNDFTFNDIDFNEFSFIPSFDFSNTRRVIARKFNYIMLKVESRTAEPMALKNIVITYKIVDKTRGVK